MAELAPKYPEIRVKLSGTEGNAFALIGRCVKAMKRAEVHQDEIDRFRKEAMSGDYDNLLRTCLKWVDAS